MNISLIVLNYNGYITTCKFIENIRDYKIINKIIVVDNNSTDDSYEILNRYGNDKVIIIKTPKNGGYSYGNNYGIKYAINNYNSDFLIISNPDVFFEENVIRSMVNIYNMYDKVGIVSPVMKNTKLQDVLSAWKLPLFKDDIILSFSILNKIFGNPVRYSKEELSNDVNIVDVLSGSFFMISRIAIQDIDYFDEDTFLYCEERILSYKLKSKGYNNIFLMNQNYIHYNSISINKSIKSRVKKYKILQESRMIYLCKYLKINKIEQIFFRIVTTLGIIEQGIIEYIKMIKNKIIQ